MRMWVDPECCLVLCDDSGWIETYKWHNGILMLVRAEPVASKVAALSIAALVRVIKEDDEKDGQMLSMELREEADRALQAALLHAKDLLRSAEDVGDKNERLENEQ